MFSYKIIDFSKTMCGESADLRSASLITKETTFISIERKSLSKFGKYVLSIQKGVLLFNLFFYSSKLKKIFRQKLYLQNTVHHLFVAPTQMCIPKKCS